MIDNCKLTLLVISLLFVTVVHAQFDTPSRPKGGALSIPNDPYIKNNNKLLNPNSDLGTPDYISKKSVDRPTQSDKKKETPIVNPKVLEMIEGEGNTNVLYKTFQRDQDLGDVTTTSGFVSIKCRDHQYVDGDMIRIYFNNKVLVPRLILKGSFSSFDLKLADGMNVIEFEALNDGLSPPNTAELNVYDDKGLLLSSKEWNIAAGFRASVLVVKL